MAGLFDYVNNVCASNESIWGEESPSEYNSYMMNRALSQFRDTVLYAQAMNQLGEYAEPKMQYDFYLGAIQPKKKRFAKWYKPEKMEIAQKLSQHHTINQKVMEQYLELIPEETIDMMMKQLEKGGRGGTK